MDRSAVAKWTGELKTGTGNIKLGSGAYDGQYSFTSRFENGTGTNPEELIAAAHAGCFSMALNASLGRAGKQPTSIMTTATVHMAKGDARFYISGITLTTRGVVPGLTAAEFQKAAEDTKTGCIVSRALAAVPMTVDAQLVTA